ncbi:MAG: phosphate acyltransferase PlsX [Aminobacterium sp.]|jgi:glycerol-3-phosphate acyltransferase PlsX|uniref:phosphate acyltransferase PlsX n=1 Tax=unclassified Aminobacterium TaxID=2685012 RepID=UPI001BCF0B4A|nr:MULTISPECIES: phosphate acyltransferase PlsX [unclassified Aminobacterium]MDD2205811.1 phosphate acyltransferase PlsX [Aminobacterium sp.]MDD3426474.1 phosphate acyltransferase PlsX [Aminobacterium sp.]MDD3706740.1 phosphate acyltransferase PlsX [Aminobacterium sp.]MDD4228174.1 phosphate acyltransferase PlsX [Aminobacterium sp.]MDD4550919.1 phosphate acyltransferase PlsX [Aminobacterium sp.]
MLLAVDAMGGDNAPHEPCKGAILACRKFRDLEIVLVGDRSQIEPIIDQAEIDVRKRLSIVHTEEFISMDEHPSQSIRKKRHSSLRLAMEMTRNGEAQGCVSAGNTGAIVAGGVLVVGRISGIDRPALGVALPTLNKYTFLLDVGATVRAKPINLYQFALMGNIYSKCILGVPSPEVALLSNGSEDIKGDEVIASAREMLKASSLKFTGYVEGDEVPFSKADVVVCDGFSGNVVLKFAEGVIQAVYSIAKEEFGRRVLPKIGILFMAPMLKDLWGRFNYEKHGGTPLLGVNGVVIKAHGRSKAPAVESAIRVARNFVLQKGVDLISDELGKEV